MFKQRVLGRLRAFIGISAIVLLSAVGCLPGQANQPPDRLIYKLPTALTIHVGAALPGTEIRYERMGEEGAEVTIKGQQALKRKGDSLDWSGSPVPGVSVDLRQRVAWYTEEDLHLVGTAKIVVDGVKPQATTHSSTSPIKYTGPVVYSVTKGKSIPGSTVIFEDQGPDGVKLGGIQGYPYRKAGDSIFWEGTLREGVHIRLDVRVLQFDARALRVGGLVTLWIGS